MITNSQVMQTDNEGGNEDGASGTFAGSAFNEEVDCITFLGCFLVHDPVNGAPDSTTPRAADSSGSISLGDVCNSPVWQCPESNPSSAGMLSEAEVFNASDVDASPQPAPSTTDGTKGTNLLSGIGTMIYGGVAQVFVVLLAAVMGFLGTNTLSTKADGITLGGIIHMGCGFILTIAIMALLAWGTICAASFINGERTSTKAPNPDSQSNIKRWPTALTATKVFTALVLLTLLHHINSTPSLPTFLEGRRIPPATFPGNITGLLGDFWPTGRLT